MLRVPDFAGVVLRALFDWLGDSIFWTKNRTNSGNDGAEKQKGGKHVVVIVVIAVDEAADNSRQKMNQQPTDIGSLKEQQYDDCNIGYRTQGHNDQL